MNSISVSYDGEAGLIEAAIRGNIDLSTVETLRARVLELVSQHNCFRILVDIRNVASSSISTVDIFHQPQQTGEALREMEISLPEMRRAIVVSDRSDDARFFETVAVNRGHRVRLFRDIGEAIDWLTAHE